MKRSHDESTSTSTAALRGRGREFANSSMAELQEGACYELRFRSLFDEGRAYAFPCDAAGHVDMDAMSDKARQNYFYARTVVGREFSMPAVQLRSLH